MNKNQQRGATSILTVLFVSLGIAAAFYGANSLLKSYQDSSLTTHSLTQSQNLAWKAEDLVNNYLNHVYCGDTNICEKNVGKVAALQGTIPVQGMNGVTVEVFNNKFASTDGYIALNIKANTGGSTVSIQSVHKAKTQNAAQTQSLNSAITVNGDTEIGSSLSITGTGTNNNVKDDIDVKGSLTLDSNQTLGNVNATSDVSLNGSTTLQTLNTNGNIQANSSYNIGYLQAGGNFSSNGSGSGTASGNVGGNVSVSDSQQATTQITASSSVNGFDVAAGTPDATSYRSLANYILDLNADVPSVYVQNVSGITTGWYPIGDDTKTATNQVVMENICKFSPSTNCISYNDGTWQIKQQGINAGVVWVNGSLSLSSLSSVKYIDSFIATGNIDVDDNVEVKAFNFATSIEACEGLYTPTNYCSNNVQTLDAVGNIALLAGGYGLNGLWTGGNITTASETISGHVVAGSSFTSSNNLTLNGGLVVSGQSLSSTQKALNIVNGLTINLSGLNANTQQLLVQTGASSVGIYAKWVRYN